MAKFNTAQSFADGDTVTGAKLNNITSQLNIYTGVISEQTAMVATVSTADQLLIADTDNGDSGAANRVTVQKLLNDTLTGGTFTNANLSGQLTYGTATGNRTVSTSATITTGTITGLSTTTGTVATLNSTTGTITGLSSTNGTIATLNSTTGTIPTLTSITKITSGTGTAAAPAISPTGDTNTGIFFPDADTIALAEGGSEVMRIDSSSNLLIGTTTSPSGSRKIVSRVSGTSNPDATLNAGAWSQAIVGSEPATQYSSNVNTAGASGATQTAKAGIGFEYINAANPTDFIIGIIGSPTVDSPVKILNGTERLRIASAGQIGIGGANYGTSGQVLTSAGTAAAPSWTTITTTPAAGSITFPMLSTSSTATDNAASRTAKAWVNFNGTGTVAIRASFNVSSITDNGPGEYTINFVSGALADADYVCVCGVDTDTATTGDGTTFGLVTSGTKTTTALQVCNKNLNAPFTGGDRAQQNVVIFR